MKTIKIGINGFGRIGRLILRYASTLKGVEVVAINDPFVTPEYAEYMFKYDTVHGAFNGEVSHDDKNLIVNGKRIAFTSILDVKDINWAQFGADYIAECTGKFRQMQDALKHIEQGAKKVVISAPGKGGVPTFVMGVNQNKYDNSMNVVSNASCTTNCFAPLAKMINDKFGIVRALMTTVHSYTATQPIVDGASKKDWRGGRAGAQNIIPSSTGASQAIGEVLPELKGKVAGCAIRVPTPNVSMVILDVQTQKQTNLQEIFDYVKSQSKGAMAGIVEYCDELKVSSDFIGNPHTCIFDAQACIELDSTFFKLFAWYDNEWAYSCKLVDLIVHMAKQ